MELCELTISQAHQGLIKKEFSALELTKAFLNRIKELNSSKGQKKGIFAFLTLTEKSALFQAKKIDSLISKNEKVPLLAGIPLAVKDNILVEDVKCTAGSKILENYIASYDAFVVKKIKDQGGIFLGKTNMDEFGMGSSTEHSAFGPTRNPLDLTLVPGGSSGGSAAAVKANMCSFALGSDTGGSIRQPASFCGVVGLKPTYGAVSRFGLIAFASSLDQIGSITKTVKDAEIVFDAISGKDFLDSTSVEMPKSQKRKLKIKDLRLGIPKEYFIEGMDSGIEKAVKGAIKKFEELGAKIEKVSLPHTKYALPAYYIISPSEASANLARYDGIRYGKREEEAIDLLDVYFKSRKKFGEEVRRRIMLGTYALSTGYYEAYYLRAQKVRTLVKEDFDKAFKRVDIILTPTSPTLAFKLGEKIKDPLLMYLSDVFTVSINLAGLPAMSIPCGEVKKLPVGLQLIAKPFEEEKILEVGKFFEENIWKQ
ncbi:Asp-tRNA(Asn)/Glu-tRNA(Gln) amidotransferase subunit GatA [Patescibacteria group bacterium]